MSDDDAPMIETCLTVAEDECRYTESEICALTTELATLRHDAACWRLLTQEMVFHVGGPLRNESAIVRHHLSRTERLVAEQERRQ